MSRLEKIVEIESKLLNKLKEDIEKGLIDEADKITCILEKISRIK